MIEVKKFRVVCDVCDAETDIEYEDCYGQQYELKYCPFCGDDDIETEERDLDETEEY